MNPLSDPNAPPLEGTAVAAADLRAREGQPPTLPTFTLRDRVVVITGGASGLGLVMGKGVVESGAHLAIVDINSDEATAQAGVLLAAFKEQYPTRPTPRITAHHADVSDPASIASCVQGIVAAHSRIDHLVTSAGFTENYPATEYPVDRMRRLWAVNVDGTYLFAVEVARHLMARKAVGGSMVFIGSMSGAIVNVPQLQTPYNASKAAVRHLASSLAVEWAESDIRVNCISPGYMATALTQNILAERPDLKEKWVGGTPMKRMGNPQDLMGPVTFLLSDAARYVTGAELRVDGGYTVV